MLARILILNVLTLTDSNNLLLNLPSNNNLTWAEVSGSHGALIDFILDCQDYPSPRQPNVAQHQCVRRELRWEFAAVAQEKLAQFDRH
jgi:hypothetical protein